MSKMCNPMTLAFFHSNSFHVKFFICVCLGFFLFLFCFFPFSENSIFFLDSCYLNRKIWCDFYLHQQAYASDGQVTSEMVNVDCYHVMIQMHFGTKHFF